MSQPVFALTILSSYIRHTRYAYLCRGGSLGGSLAEQGGCRCPSSIHYWHYWQKVRATGYGYRLRGGFEERTSSAWPLNTGQVYTTLDRLERDALVEKEGDDGAGHVIYSITGAGCAEVMGWLAQPVAATNPPRCIQICS